MDVSVIVPALNEERYIEKTLKSIKRQKTKLEYELVVSDGHSSDKTAGIARKYADKLIFPKTKGIWAGRNAGALNSTGKILVFIDADTIIPNNYLESVWRVMQDKKISGLSFGFRFDKAKGILKIIEDISNNYLFLKGKLGIGELLGFNCIMRRIDFIKVGGFPNKPLEDAGMARRLHKRGKVIYKLEPRVITSSRRMEKGGIMKSIEYYANLEIMTHMPKIYLAKLTKYKNYLPIR